MSGEIVLFPEAAAVQALFNAANTLIDARQQAIREKVEQKKAALSQWQQFQAHQSQLAERLRQATEDSRRSQERLADVVLNPVERDETEQAPATHSEAEDFLGTRPANPAEQAQRQRLEQLRDLLKDLPDALTEEPNSPIERLQQQAARLLQRPSEHRSEIIDTFAEAIRLTLQDGQDRLQRREAQTRSLLDRCDVLLDRVVSYQLLAGHGREHDELVVVQTALQKQLSAMAVSPGALDLLERKFSALAKDIEQRMQAGMIQDSVAEKVTRHLSAMGYPPLELFGDHGNERRAIFGVPGGERLAVALHGNHQIAFQIQHEHCGHGTAQMNDTEMAFLRQQEDRWCTDLPELIRRLTRDGLSYRVQFERNLATESIPVVVVDTADDILRESSEREDLNRFKRRAQANPRP